MNKTKFKAVMLLNGDTFESIAEYLGVSPTTISYKLNGKCQFKQGEIQALKKKWKLKAAEMVEIFFD